VKQDFADMLKQCREIKAGMHFHNILPFIEDDPRFKAIEDEDLRQDLCHRFVQDIEDKEKAERLKKFETAAEKLRKKLKARTDITYKSNYRDLEKDYCDDMDLGDLRQEDIARVIKKFIRDLERKREEEKRLEREKKRKRERDERDKRREQERAEAKELKALFGELSDRANPLFHAKSRWEEVKEHDDLKNDARYKVFVDSDRARRAYEEFEKYCHGLDSELQNDKKEIKKYLKKEGPAITPEDKVADLMEKHKDVEAFKTITDRNKRLLFFEMIAKAAWKQEEMLKEQKKEEERRKRREERDREREKRRDRSRSRRRRSRSRDRPRRSSRSRSRRRSKRDSSRGRDDKEKLRERFREEGGGEEGNRDKDRENGNRKRSRSRHASQERSPRKVAKQGGSP